MSRRQLARLGAELVVIFLGVYGAFLAESIRQDREDEEAARSTYLALAEEIEDHVTLGQRVLDEYVATQAEWEASYARGSRPDPWAIPWTASAAGPPLSAWPATLSAGGVRLIDQDLFYRLAKYYRSVDAFLVPVDSRDSFSETEVFPHAGDTRHFYEGSELRPHFRQYIELRRATLEGAQSTIEEGRGLLEELRMRAERR